jgi:FAD:protein FMN transferase
VPTRADPALCRFQAMASPCEIRLDQAEGVPSVAPSVAPSDGHAGQTTRHAALAQAMAEVQRIEAKYSRYRADSVISQINAGAGLPDAIAVDDETAALLDFAATLHADSEGRFDVSSGVLRRAWDFKGKALPSDARLAELQALVGWGQVAWDGRHIRLPRAGMELDFGGIGKEYAADRAASLLQGLGFTQGFVNLGGDIRVLGPRPDGQPWRFGIQHPRRPQALIAHIDVGQGALATSGDYERFLIHQGQRYGHILDARTGWPVQHWQSVSVVAPACVAAGALSTIAMLMGEQALDFLRAQGVAFLAIDDQGRPHAHALDADLG